MQPLTMREAYGQALVALGESNPDVVVLDADVSKSSRSTLFGERFPERFFNVGIAESNMMSVAAGLAASGKIPFVNSFSFLLTLRAGEQLRTGIAYPRLNVKVAGAYCGLSDSFDGPTHQDPMDLAVMRAMPNMTVISVSDSIQAKKVVAAAAAWPGPVYFRLNRNALPEVSTEDSPFEIGKAIWHRRGADVTLIATGIMVHRALEAARLLETDGLKAGVLEVHTIKPIDTEAVMSAARETGAIVTAEEHNIYGGLGGAVAELLVEHGPVPMERVGIRDTFAESGDYEALLAKYGLTSQAVVDAARKVMRRK
ncbi:MAG: 1-deoxy-D-xylulose-5-phosphate synthase [Firmicutes bacterium ADurb.Bin506]|jgi:transketolase|nr:MAG: 1-deoxy-D-xylulose-5-phosphate synthase [Firmicutes bacterium ADurb.Bin506]